MKINHDKLNAAIELLIDGMQYRDHKFSSLYRVRKVDVGIGQVGDIVFRLRAIPVLRAEKKGLSFIALKYRAIESEDGK